MKNNFDFKLLTNDNESRLGILSTSNGLINTPTFMPVGTSATVKGIMPEQIIATNSEIILCNTYHLMLRPGIDIIKIFGGINNFMKWKKPILSDSGGFQVMSLASLAKSSDEGIKFKSHIDGKKIFMSPESCMDLQVTFDVDIAMVLDECLPFPADYKSAQKSMLRSMSWAERSKKSWFKRQGKGLFGIVQGGIYEDLRINSVDMLQNINFDGYAIGGLAVGEGQEEMLKVLDYTTKLLPIDKPRYLMGVGKPDDIVKAVLKGIDMFDCVLPTRSGRTGQAFTRNGPINIRNACFARDTSPLDEYLPNSASNNFSKAYLHHLFKSKEILGAVLLTIHNISFYQWLMQSMRDAIKNKKMAEFSSNFLEMYTSTIK
ncbi:MAG: tRNA guanosine(34) transglycosylase Tgt [Rhodospirillaceae bacterium]|nr:tRNA guanosine(34) transglycosylase Tgt [Rhodospirillaceae bacterium]|tara:strand:+ start:19242 stop:20363 length:1122 start_codon:yes stop_codon:yes gene_type:complete